jgi:hypothetical protein
MYFLRPMAHALLKELKFKIEKSWWLSPGTPNPIGKFLNYKMYAIG